MKKIGIQNLGLIVTNRCNLNCAHCMRGCKNNKDMSKEVIDATLSQITTIGNLCLCGGEITFALNTLNYIFDYIIKNHILLEEVTAVINGTNYSDDFLKLLDYINEYIETYSKEKAISHATFTISKDIYHLNEISKLKLLKQYLENIQNYQNSIHYAGIQPLIPNLKLFREGNAEYLDKSLTVKLRPIKLYSTYIGNDKKFDRENGLFYVGPLLTVNTDEIVTECDASLEHMQTKYNYGNVLNESIEVISLRKSKVLKPDSCYKHWCKEANRYETYNR